MGNFTEILGYVLAAVTALSTVVVTIKNQAKDASEKAKDATINSQNIQLETVGKENQMYRSREDEMTGKVKALENMVTQAPQIIDLTKVVTELVAEVKSQTHQNSEQNKQVIKLLTQMVKQDRNQT